MKNLAVGRVGGVEAHILNQSAMVDPSMWLYLHHHCHCHQKPSSSSSPTSSPSSSPSPPSSSPPWILLWQKRTLCEQICYEASQEAARLLKDSFTICTSSLSLVHFLGFQNISRHKASQKASWLLVSLSLLIFYLYHLIILSSVPFSVNIFRKKRLLGSLKRFSSFSIYRIVIGSFFCYPKKSIHNSPSSSPYAIPVENIWILHISRKRKNPCYPLQVIFLNKWFLVQWCFHMNEWS